MSFVHLNKHFPMLFRMSTRSRSRSESSEMDNMDLSTISSISTSSRQIFNFTYFKVKMINSTSFFYWIKLVVLDIANNFLLYKTLQCCSPDHFPLPIPHYAPPAINICGRALEYTSSGSSEQSLELCIRIVVMSSY